MVTGTNTNPPTLPAGWGDDNWTFAVESDNPPPAGIGAAVGQEACFNYFVTTAVVSINYNFNPFSGERGGGGHIIVPPRERRV